MIGEIISYSEEKGYGFIKTKNDSIFFHKSNIKGFKPKDGMIVKFEKVPSSKGYKAKNIKRVDASKIKYEVPDNVLISKTSSIKGYEVLSRGRFDLIGASRNLDDAKDWLKVHAMSVGANGLINYRYEKTTESESSNNGNGTYYYTVHHFIAEPVFIGKKSIDGYLEKSSAPDLNTVLWEMYLDGEKKNSKNFKTLAFLWLIAIMLIIYFFNYGMPENINDLFVKKDDVKWILPSIITVFVSLFMTGFLNKGDQNSWLRPHTDI